MDSERLRSARDSLSVWLGEDLSGRSFLDAGCGSGLFSLAARDLGAKVTSFDFDSRSVATALALRDRFSPGDEGWRITAGSVLDGAFLHSLGEFDIVYSWGVLHHTGEMWSALESVAGSVVSGGLLWISIYNDLGRRSRRWLRVKRFYNRVPEVLRPPIVGLAFLRVWGPTFLRDALAGRPFRTWRNYGEGGRGMSPWHDLVHWVGGYPYEVARVEQLADFLAEKGFTVVRLRTNSGLGTNELLLRRGG